MAVLPALPAAFTKNVCTDEGLSLDDAGKAARVMMWVR